MSRKEELELKREIADTLKELRLKKDLTQLEIAEKAGINSNNYAKVERGERLLSILTLKKIVKALGIKSSDILGF